MGVAFSDSAEFPRISREPVKIDQVIHKTVLKVTENGVEAAAVTVVKMQGRAKSVTRLPILCFQSAVHCGVGR
ncbi:hypothetical protein BLNAU_24235 [Blattamonas nauphoetae]|uniref:Serpin domain-containing protein n=1 Tax=Blattamonas nauphoetae TaxID=2049346 RepID=A0ABQ9WN20_9EUKA|nr:hypothetical protein BLNAU_24235 [Blattamonas nauphoetae]